MSESPTERPSPDPEVFKKIQILIRGTRAEVAEQQPEFLPAFNLIMEAFAGGGMAALMKVQKTKEAVDAKEEEKKNVDFDKTIRIFQRGFKEKGISSDDIDDAANNFIFMKRLAKLTNAIHEATGSDKDMYRLNLANNIKDMALRAVLGMRD